MLIFAIFCTDLIVFQCGKWILFPLDKMVTKIAARHATELIHKHSTDASHVWMLEIVPHHHNAPCLFGMSGIRCYFLEKKREGMRVNRISRTGQSRNWTFVSFRRGGADGLFLSLPIPIWARLIIMGHSTEKALEK